MGPAAVFWARCSVCQHVGSFVERPDRCPACEAPIHIVLPICGKEQKKLERREKRFNGRPWQWNGVRRTG